MLPSSACPAHALWCTPENLLHNLPWYWAQAGRPVPPSSSSCRWASQWLTSHCLIPPWLARTDGKWWNNFTRFLGEQFLGGSHLAMQTAQNLVNPENNLGKCSVSVWKRFCSYSIYNLLQVNSFTKYPTQINLCLCGHCFWSFWETKKQ